MVSRTCQNLLFLQLLLLLKQEQPYMIQTEIKRKRKETKKAEIQAPCLHEPEAKTIILSKLNIYYQPHSVRPNIFYMIVRNHP